MTNIQLIQEAAFKKFGTPLEVIWKDEAKHADFFFVAVKRDTYPFPDAPYMTITSSVNKEGEVSFFWGHYDLDLGQLVEAVGHAKRNAVAA